MAKFVIIASVFLLLYITNGVTSTKLNYPRVLLPIFDKISINFTLEVTEGGCFKWLTPQRDLILISPLYEDFESECSSKAVVTVLTRERRRNTAIVLAENKATDDVLRCDVILDVIDQLRVLTTTRELYLEEAPETFELWAQDSQGNAFTTLEGVEFDWKILPISKEINIKTWQPALRFLTFGESSYHEVPKALEKLEARNVRGYMVLLEGINTGNAKVTVRFPYPEYSSVPLLEVHINVLANIILNPSDVHILAGDTIAFHILQLKQGKLYDITNAGQYYLEIEDQTIATLRSNTVTGKRLGETFVVLRDRNMPHIDKKSTEAAVSRPPVPKALVAVSSPVKLAVDLLPYHNWVTVEGEKHEICVDLFTNDDQKITLGPRYSLTTVLNETLFHVLGKSKNGSRIHGQAMQVGTNTVLASFKELNAKVDMQIYKELILKPAKVVLPFDPNKPTIQKFQFVATGGDGAYVWTSQNPSRLQITQTGMAYTRIDADFKMVDECDDQNKMLSKKYGHIRVALQRNTKIHRTSEVYFLPPAKLEIVKYNFETPLRDYVKLHLAVYAFTNGTFIPFTKCDNLNFIVEFSNQIFQVESANTEEDELAPKACHVIYLRSMSMGTTQTTVSCKLADSILQDIVTLVVFEKLSVLNPVENEIVLPIGSSRNILYDNGPQKLFSVAAELIKTLKYDQKIIEVKEPSLPELTHPTYVYNVLCRKIGETTLTFEIFNALQAKHVEPYISSYDTIVRCVKPRFLNLYATEELRSSCPLQMKNAMMHFRENDEKCEIEIEVLDEKHRKLMNISSLVIQWQYAPAGGAYNRNLYFYQEHEDERVRGILVSGRDLMVSSVRDVGNSFKIKGTVTSYNTEVLGKYKITPESPAFGIKKTDSEKLFTPIIQNEIDIMAVNNTLFPMDHISIFLAKNMAQKVRVQQGSGFYDFHLSEPGVISIEYNSNTKQLIIVPLKIGNVHVELVDRCLMNKAATLMVSVVKIGSIKVDMPDKVQIGKSVEAIISLYDSNEHLLLVDSNNLHLYELNEEIFHPDVLTVKLGDQSNLELGEIRYTVTGVVVGDTKIIFKSGYGENSEYSSPVSIQVFSPVRLYPRNSTITVGSSVQIYHLGGPHPDVNIIYSIHDQDLLSIESGLVTGLKLGSTKITGKCIGRNPITGQDMTISVDTVEIHVVALDGIEINMPLVRIKSGAVMPAYVWGVPDLSPMVLGTLDNINLVWSTDQPDVVDIFNVFSEAGIEYSDRDLISVRIKALNPGKAKIKVILKMASGQRLAASSEIIVFRMLELESPKPISMDSILIAPRSIVQLKSNLDDVIYKSESDASNRIIRVSSDGLVRAGDVLGRELIIAKTYEQTLPIGIEVKNVQYILVSLQHPAVKLKEAEDKIPRGMNFILKVSLHDNLGNEFSPNIDDTNGIKYDLSHKDTVDVQLGNNLTIAINLPRETRNMIAISLRDGSGVKNAVDYIKLSVAESENVYPTKKIFAVGDVICFETPLTLSSHWSSSDEKMVSIDRNTGVARVLGNRLKMGEKVIVTNGDSAGSYLKYDVEIREADQIEFFNAFDIFCGTSYRGHLIVRNHLQVDKFANLVARNISKCSGLIDDKLTIKLFTCRLSSKQPLGISLLEHYTTTPYFDVEKWAYACQIDLITSFGEVLNVVRTNDVSFELEAQLPNGMSDVLTLKFVPGVRVTPTQLLVDNVDTEEISILGMDKVLHKVEVKPSHTSVLEVVLVAKMHGSLQYKLKQLNQLPTEEQLFIHVHSPLTHQDIRIPIVGSNGFAPKCSSRPLSKVSTFLSGMSTIISIIVIIGASIWVFMVVSPPERRHVRDINNEAFTPSKNKSGRNSPTCPPSPSTQSPQQRSNLYYGSPGMTQDSRYNDSPVYGDTTLSSPLRRIHRRFL